MRLIGYKIAVDTVEPTWVMYRETDGDYRKGLVGQISDDGYQLHSIRVGEVVHFNAKSAHKIRVDDRDVWILDANDILVVESK